MSPSPAVRISPRRELRAADNHKRRHSLGSGIISHDKEDDLALFNEVKEKERDNFLLQSDDNFDDVFSTNLKCFSDYKSGISIPAQGESSGLLNAEGDKNDYDWLISPPETPLFHSLDDEAPQVNLAPGGRPRSQPVSISKSPTGCRSGRDRPSPRRLSPSPRSGNSPLQSRNLPLSATHSSSPPTIHHSSPSRRQPSPARRHSSPSGRGPSPSVSHSSPSRRQPSRARRSITPTARRMSTGTMGPTAPLRTRGNSPARTSRENSPSPRKSAWQSDIPGFSLEVPPNLRTSLGERPASYMRGSSPASRYGRQSMSPKRREQGPVSSRSRGSVASYGDDDVDSLQSIPVSISDQSASRKNQAMSFSKKPTKLLSSSAPKRSSDLVQQMDQKASQNMFRPHLSSVPSSTFYMGKENANSSITTSSNTSSDQAAIGPHDTEECDPDHDHITIDCLDGHYPDVHNEVFFLDKDYALNEDFENRILGDPLCMESDSFELNLTIIGETGSEICISSLHEDSFEVVGAHMDKEIGEEMCAYPHEQPSASDHTEVEGTCTDSKSNIIFKTASVDTLVGSVLASEEVALHENRENFPSDSGNSMNAGTFIQEEDPQTSSLDAISEAEMENVDIVVSADSQSDIDCTNSKMCTNELQQSDLSDPAHEESSIMLEEDSVGTKGRQLTLEEATDAILFCSSIVHNLAYEAANIAIDNETVPMEPLQPTAISAGDSTSERRDTRLKSTGKRGSKSQEAQEKSIEMDTRSPSCNAETNEKPSPCIVGPTSDVDTMRPLPMPESKCNCIVM